MVNLIQNNLQALKSVLCLIILIFLNAIGVAKADEQDTLNFVAGVSSQHDNNLFKAQDNEESEQINTMFAGLKLDKQYSLQRFRANVTITNNKYSSNDFLNFTSKNYDLAWLWALTPKLTGTLSADRSESLNNFNDLRVSGIVRQQNINVTQNQLFLADYAPGSGWHLLAGVSRSSLKNSETFNAISAFSANSLDLGVKYDFASASSITLMNHARKGSYDDRPISQASLLDNGYKEYEQELRVNWIVTAKSQLSLVASYLDREHDNISRRDFSGLQGGLTYNWAPTAKINVLVSAQSSLAAFQSNDNNYTRINAFSLSPSYALSSHIKLTANLIASEREFLGDAVVQSNGRIDKVKSMSLGVQWTPTRYLNLGASVQRYHQNSNILGFDYDDTTAGLSANVLF